LLPLLDQNLKSANEHQTNMRSDTQFQRAQKQNVA